MFKKEILAFSFLFVLINVSLSLTITWNVPSSNGNYYWDNFTLNVSTDVNANCSYWISYSLNGTNLTDVIGMQGNNSTLHTSLINVESLPHGENLTIHVSCFNSSNSSETSEDARWFLRDYECGDAVTHSWVLGYDLNCSWYNNTILLITSDNIEFNCNTHKIIGNSSVASSVIRAQNRNNVTVMYCNISNARWGVHYEATTNGKIINNFFYNIGSGTSGVFHSAIYLSYGSDNNFIFNNTVYNSIRGVVIYYNSRNNSVKNNKIYNSEEEGIKLDNCPEINIIDSNYVEGGEGLLVEDSSVLSVNNTFHDPTTFGIKLDTNYTCNITLNTITLATRGVEITSVVNPNNLSIYKNRIYNNTYNFYSANTSLSIYLDYNGQGNYWGYPSNSCPGFVPGVDSNSLQVIDRYPYTSPDFSDEACDCGDNVWANVTLYKDVICDYLDAEGLHLVKSNIQLNCNGHLITTTSKNGDGIVIMNNSTAIFNCKISNFSVGILSQNTYGHLISSNIIWHNENQEGSGIVFANVRDTTIYNNSIYENDEGIFLANCYNITITNNNIYNNTYGTSGSHLGFNDTGGNINITLAYNYWGYSNCSLYLFNRDSNSLWWWDHNPVSEMSNWSSILTCNISPIFNDVDVRKADGTSPTHKVQGTTALYDENNQPVSVPYQVYQYFYYPNQNITFYVNISQYNYRFFTLNVHTDSIYPGGYNYTIENISIPYYANGLYKITIFNLNESLFNYSNEHVNSTPQVLEFYLTIVDTKGNNNTIALFAIYNFTPQKTDTNLSGDTTDWSTIEDFTNVTNLTFETPLAKIRFDEPVNLANPLFIHGLRMFGKYMRMQKAKVSLDPSVFAVLNKSATVWLYNLTFNNTPGLLMNGEPVVLSNGSSYTITDNTTITDFYWDETNHTLRFKVTHWSTYEADGDKPVLTISISPSYIKKGNQVTIECSANEDLTEKNVTVTDPNGNVYVVEEGEPFIYTSLLGEYTITCKAKDKVGLESTKTATFTVHKKSSGGGGSYTPPIKESFIFFGVKKGQVLKFNFTNKELGLLFITYKTNEDGNSKFSAEKIDNLPSNIPSPNKKHYLYYHFQITNGANATLEFKVSKSWISSNNIDPNSITLIKYNEELQEWISLPTSLIREDSSYYYYQSQIPSFSYFAIVGEEKKEEKEIKEENKTEEGIKEEEKEKELNQTKEKETPPSPSICGNNICEQNENCSSCPSDCKCKENEYCDEGICKPKPKFPTYLISASILVILVLVTVFFFYKK